MPSDDAPHTAPTASTPPMRLLIVTYEYPPLGGGLGKAVRETALELVKRGCDVTILTSRFGEIHPDSVDGPLRIVRVRVLRRFLHYAHAFEVLSFAISGLLAARRRLGSEPPDLILAYLTIPSGIVAAWLASRWKVPFMTLLRGTDVPGSSEIPSWMHRLAAPVTRAVWRRSARVVSNSHAMARMARAAMPGLDVAVVHNGVRLDRFRPGDRDAAHRPLRVLYAGRLVRVKRLEVLIRAWAALPPDLRDNARLVLAGFGPDRRRLEILAADRDISDSVEFPGRLDENDLIAALQDADLFVSLSRFEGLPNAVIEAMACGLPVLLSRIGPHEELIGDSGAGLLCGGDDVREVASALERLLQNADKMRLMGIEARRRVESAFDWSRTADQFLRLFPRAPR